MRSGGGDGSVLVHWPALLLVLGGSVAAATLASSRRTALHALSAASRLFFSRTITTSQVAEALVEVARQARANGHPAITPESVGLRDPFLRQGLQLVADGVAPERIEELLQVESEVLSGRRSQAERLFRIMGRSSLLLGAAGTLIALLQLPASPGGAAVLASLGAACHGLLLAGLLFLPLASKVRTLDLHEQLVRDQMVTGLLGIRLGQNPEYVRESLQVFARKKG